MSTYWNLWCKTCNVEVLHTQLNDCTEAFSKLTVDVPALIALAEHNPAILIDIEETYLFYGVGLDCGTVRVDCFLPHKGHTLRPKNEYGRWSNQCTGRTACAVCGDSRDCILPYGHPGDHQHEQPKKA